MRNTERIRRPALVEPLRNLPITLVALFIVMAAVDALLVMQPSLVRSLRDDWQTWVHGSISAPWATLVGAVATVGGLAIAAAMLTLAVRGIVEAPYLWLASALVAGCCFSISRVAVDLPVRMPTPAFSAMSSLLLVGGGAFFQSRATLFNMTGLFLTSTPLALLGVGYLRARTSTGAPYTIDHNAEMVLGLLLLASAGTILIAVASRRLRALGGAAAIGTPSGAQLAELIERARSSEQRAAEAEYQLEHVLEQAGGAPRLLEDDELAMGRRGRSGGWGRWLLLSFLAIGGGAAYFTVFQPLQHQLDSQRKFNHEQTRKHASELSALRADLEREREQLKAQAAAAAQPAAPAKPEAKKKAAAAVAPTSDASPAKPAPAEKASPSEKPGPSEKPAPAAKPAPANPAANAHANAPPPVPADKPSVAKAAPADKPAPATKPAAAAKPAAPPKPAKPAPLSPLDRTLQSTSDDPLEGLDGM